MLNLSKHMLVVVLCCILCSPQLTLGQKTIVIEENHTSLFKTDPGFIDTLLVKGKCIINLPDKSTLKIGKLIIDGGSLDIGRPDKLHQQQLNILLGDNNKLEEDHPAIIVKNEGRLNLLGNKNIFISPANPNMQRSIWIDIDFTARHCRFLGVIFSAFQVFPEDGQNGIIRWDTASGFMEKCTLKDTYGPQILLNASQVQIENCQFEANGGAPLTIISPEVAENAIRNNDFKVESNQAYLIELENR